MPTVFFNQGDANAALSSGLYRRQPLAPAVVASEPVAVADPDDVVDQPDPEASTAEVTGINVNTASLVELTSISGVGLARGREIIEGRPYASAEDLIAITEAVDWLRLEQDGEISY